MQYRARLRGPGRPLGCECALAVLGVILMLSATASGQSLNPHGLGAGPRPLHLRMADAGVAALIEIRSIDTGRIEAVRVLDLLGDLPREFQIKRAPSHPPAVVEGDWMLALLAGERSPYILLDQKQELSVISEADRAVWLVELPAYTAELKAALDGESDGAPLLARYERWIDAGPESLRKLGLRGLLDPTAPFAPLDRRFAARRVAAALRPGGDPTARIGSALAASFAPGGATLLLESLDAGSEVTPEVVAVALQGGLRTGSPETAPALIRLLGHPDAGVRARTLEMVTAVDRPGRLRARVEAMAEDDPDAEVRRAAETALRRYGS